MNGTPTPRLVPDRPSDADYRRIAHLIGSIFYAGNFKAETPNEVELEAMLVKTGHRYASWEEIDAAAPPAEAPKIFSEHHGVDLRSIKVGEVLTQAQWDAVCAFVREQDAIIDSAKESAEAPAERGAVASLISAAQAAAHVIGVAVEMSTDPTRVTLHKTRAKAISNGLSAAIEALAAARPAEGGTGDHAASGRLLPISEDQRMTTDLNPADAVREAPRYWVGLVGMGDGPDEVAQLRDVQGQYVLHDDHARIVAALTARVAVLESDAERTSSCPWRVQKGCTALCQPPKNMREALQRAEQAESRLAALAGAAPDGDGVVAETENVRVEAGFVYENGSHTPTALISFKPNDWAARDQFVAKVKAPHSPAKAREELTDAQLDAIYNALDSWVLSLEDYDFALPSITKAARDVMRAALATFADGGE